MEFIVPWSVAKKRLQIILEDGALRILTGARVIMRGTQKSNLYYMQGSINIGEIHNSIESKRMKHLRLANASEIPMQTTFSELEFGKLKVRLDKVVEENALLIKLSMIMRDVFKLVDTFLCTSSSILVRLEILGEIKVKLVKAPVILRKYMMHKISSLWMKIMVKTSVWLRRRDQ